MKPVVLAAAQEAGGANVLIPVIRALQEKRGLRVEVLASGQAGPVFQRAEVPHRVVASPRDGLGNFPNPDGLLLGTAWGRSIDKILLQRFRNHRIPSLAIVDNWSSYGERWTDPETGETVYPTRIALPDDRARTQALQAGLPESLLTVTGHPYLETLGAELRGASLHLEARALRHTWENQLKGSPQDTIFLFASEAFSEDFGPETPYDRGYTQVEALEGTVEALRLLESAGGFQPRLMVKLHPQEQLELYRCGPRASEWRAQNRLRLIEGAPPWPCMLASDGVVGMTSLLLLEAALAGKRSVSFQPGVRPFTAFIGSEAGLVPIFLETEALARHLSEGWKSAGEPPRAQAQAIFSQAQGAALRTAQLFSNLISAPEEACRP